jgi:hypothetical protein
MERSGKSIGATEGPSQVSRKEWTRPAFVRLKAEEAENSKGTKPSDASKNS